MLWVVTVLMLTGSGTEIYSSAIAADERMCRDVAQRVNGALAGTGRHAVCLRMKPIESEAPRTRV